MINKQTGASKFHPSVPLSVREHLLGKRHSNRHKFIFGFLISFFGASLAHYCHYIHPDILSLMGDHIGFGIHGIGFIPMYKAVEKGGTV